MSKFAPDSLNGQIADLRKQRRWVVWKTLKRDGRPTKMPFSPRSEKPAKSTDPKTWGTYASVKQAVRRGGYDGVGFMLGDGYVGVDLDDCRDPKTGTLASWASRIVKAMKTYA